MFNPRGIEWPMISKNARSNRPTVEIVNGIEVFTTWNKLPHQTKGSFCIQIKKRHANFTKFYDAWPVATIVSFFITEQRRRKFERAVEEKEDSPGTSSPIRAGSIEGALNSRSWGSPSVNTSRPPSPSNTSGPCAGAQSSRDNVDPLILAPQCHIAQCYALCRPKFRGHGWTKRCPTHDRNRRKQAQRRRNQDELTPSPQNSDNYPSLPQTPQPGDGRRTPFPASHNLRDDSEDPLQLNVSLLSTQSSQHKPVRSPRRRKQSQKAREIESMTRESQKSSRQDQERIRNSQKDVEDLRTRMESSMPPIRSIRKGKGVVRA